MRCSVTSRTKSGYMHANSSGCCTISNRTMNRSCKIGYGELEDEMSKLGLK